MARVTYAAVLSSRSVWSSLRPTAYTSECELSTPANYNVYNALSILCLSSFSSNTNTYRTAGEFVIVMGSTYLQSSDANTLQYYVQEVIVHPLFHYNSLNNDIAVMFINGYIPWQAKAVKALPLQNSSLPVSTSCVVTGWGVLSDVSVLYLLHIYVCSFVYRFARLSANQRLKG